MLSHRYRNFKFSHGGQEKQCDIMIFVSAGKVVGIINGVGTLPYRLSIYKELVDKKIFLNYLFVTSLGTRRNVCQVLPDNSISRIAELEVIEREYGILIPL